eukprot:TRINITY_DN696_c0_g2_i2.p1 TRINITY_DN696_c0_g2~~TRINITY_DN696_c0_g2_i2.p1  ORF type:complete len:282 (+),score=69.35 TRINITY_DN696_c0_g2_i2:139-984(+)
MIPTVVFCLIFVASALANGNYTFNGYDEEFAHLQTHFAGMAYCDKDTILRMDCSNSCQRLNGAYIDSDAIYGHSSHMMAIVAVNPSRRSIGVSFRGTNDVHQWVIDAEFPHHSNFAGVHGADVEHGFYSCYSEIRDSLWASIAARVKKYGFRDIELTGHSLGGSTASLAAFELSQVYNVRNVYTMGAPRTGNRKYSEELHRRVPVFYRLVHYRDLVPRVPGTFLGYHHEPREVFYNEEFTSYKLCNGSGEDGHCSDKYSMIEEFKTIYQLHTHYFNWHVNC